MRKNLELDVEVQGLGWCHLQARFDDNGQMGPIQVTGLDGKELDRVSMDPKHYLFMQRAMWNHSQRQTEVDN